MGAAKIEAALPPLLDARARRGRQAALWCCDPMHGNTETLGNGFKTRRFENIRDELDRAFDIHAACGTRLGGVHLELTGENVTECMGGARDLTETDLDARVQIDRRSAAQLRAVAGAGDADRAQARRCSRCNLDSDTSLSLSVLPLARGCANRRTMI